MFRGSPREAAVGFPANLNVAVSVSLAGIGPDRTTLEIWADPALERNIHRVEVDSDSASFSMEIQNIPRPIPRLAASPRKASSPRCASLPGRCAWAPESGRRPARAAAARDTDWTPARQPRSRPARLHQRK